MPLKVKIIQTYMYYLMYEHLYIMTLNLDVVFLLSVSIFSSFLASSDFCHLPIAFANSLDPDQDRQNVHPDLDLNHLTI